MNHTVLRVRWVELALGLILVVGLLWRLLFYLWDVSLWHDELMLASTIVQRGLLGMLQPLENSQAAPLLFLFSVEAVTGLFGESEKMLRLVPLLCSCLALSWMCYFAKKYLDPLVAVFACSIIAFANPLIAYAVNFKPYSGDLLASVIALHMFTISVKSRRMHIVRALLVVSLPWFSFPSIFVIAGLTAGHGLYSLSRRDYSEVLRTSLLGICGLLSFLIYYFLLIKSVSVNDTLVNFWVHFYFDAPWFSGRNYQIFDTGVHYIVNVMTAWTTPVFILGGLLGLWKNPKGTLPSIMVIAVVVVASALDLYPFCQRLLIFLYPFFTIVIGQWFVFVSHSRKLRGGVGLCVIAAVFMNHFSKNWRSTVDSPVYQEVRESFEYVEEHRTLEDSIYMVPPFDEMAVYYEGYSFLDSAQRLEDLSDLGVGQMVKRRSPFWVISEARRADQSEFLIELVARVKELSEGVEYELFYIDFQKTMLLYFKPISTVE